jgi:hypothetical protein
LTRELEMGVGLRTDANARYFGLGPESHESRESFYSHEVAWGGVGLRQSLARKIQFEARLILSGISARSPGSEEPALATEFAGEIPPGYDDRSSGASTVLTLAQDTTTENGRPERGGVRRATFAWFQPTEGDAAFTTARLELQQFIPLWHSKRALALRGHVTRLHYKGDDPIPFQRLLTNDAPDLFRGYKEFRWRDQGLLGLTAEYRWPIWARKSAEDLGVDAYMLFDAGQVYHQTADISADNLTTSYGFGFRLVSAYGFIGTLEFGRSEEESSFRLGAEQVFQFSRNGLYFGRNPFPVR